MEQQSSILIVDDDPTDRHALQTLLVNDGYKLYWANNGEEAISKAAQLYPDLVLLALKIPGIDGLEVCKRLRRDNYLGEVPVIIIAQNDPSDRLRALEAGADDFVSKPFDEIELCTRIRAITRLNRYRTLLQQKKCFTQLVEFIPDSLALLDSRGIILMANPALCGLLLEENLNGKLFTDYVLKRNRNHFQNFVLELQGSGIRIDRTELYLINARGCFFPVEIRAQISQWNSDQIIIALISDITERKDHENKLRESEAKLKLIVEASEDIIYMVDVEGKILFISPAIFRLTGQAEENLEGRNIISYVHPDDLGECLEALKLLFIKQEDTAQLEYRIKDRQLNWRWMSSTLSAVKDPSGQVVYAVGVARDVSQRVAFEDALIQAKNEAEQANKAKDYFLANLSHEIRSPINGIIGMTELLLNTRLNRAQQELAQISVNSAQQLLAVINEILDFSKIEAGKLLIENQPFEFRKLLSHITQVLELQAQQKGLKFSVWIDARIPDIVAGDALHLQQILQNLANNALKFTERGAIVLTVKLLEEADSSIRLQFAIQDTGIGIAEAIQPKLFQAFVQGDGSTTRKYGGTGLGLVICKKLVEAMGGEIEFQSREGQGTIFKVSLTFHKSNSTLDRDYHAQPIDEASQPTVESEFDKNKAAKILLVEDDQVSRRLGELQLQELGYTVDCAGNGQEALEKVATGNYDLIFMDSNMPIMDGFQASHEIRKREQGTLQHMPIIALTARAMSGDRELCLEAGMDDYISKPASLNAISQLLDRWLKTDNQEQSGESRVQQAKPSGMVGLDIKQSNMCKDLLPLFLETTRGRLLELQEAYHQKDWEKLTKVAHATISSSLAIGAESMAETARSLEMNAGNFQYDGIELLLHKLQGEYQQITDWYDQQIQAF